MQYRQNAGDCMCILQLAFVFKVVVKFEVVVARSKSMWVVFGGEYTATILPLTNLPTIHRNVAAVAATIAQASHLKAMTNLTGDSKKEACGRFADLRKQLQEQFGDAGMDQLMKCPGDGEDFAKAYQFAKAFCGGCNLAAGLVCLYSANGICIC